MTRTSPKREVIIFDVNTPVVMSLAYPDGKEIPSKFEGARRFMFSTTDNKTFFCSEQVRNILVGMKLRKGERIQICKRETRLKGEKSSRPSGRSTGLTERGGSSVSQPLWSATRRNPTPGRQFPQQKIILLLPRPPSSNL
jgi:hypothetical protein